MLQGFLLFIILMLASCSGTDTGNPIVSGTDTGNPTIVAGVLKDSLGNPAPACSIWVRQQVSMPVGATLAKVRAVASSPFSSASLQTDSSGAFEIAGLRAGDYVMVVIANNKSGGRLLRFSLTPKDTLNFTDSLTLEPLQDLVVVLNSAWLGRTALVPELDYSVKISSDTLRVPLVPQGFYSIEAKGDTVLWRLDTNTRSISPFSLDTTSSSSSQGTSSSQATSSTVVAQSSSDFSSSVQAVSSSLSLSSSSPASSMTTTSSSAESSSFSSISISSSSSLIPASSSSFASSSVPSSSSAPDTLVVNWIGSGRGTLEDPRDSVTYHVTSFTGATWFAENLRVVTAASSCDTYDPNAATTCDVYGRFYTFADASSGICPKGWRLPAAIDWQSLIFQVGSAGIAGSNLRSSSGWYVNNGTDSFGMSMLPAGLASSPSSGTDAYFWADTTNGGLPGAYHINTASAAITLEFLSATEGVNVRCVR